MRQTVRGDLPSSPLLGLIEYFGAKDHIAVVVLNAHLPFKNNAVDSIQKPKTTSYLDSTFIPIKKLM